MLFLLSPEAEFAKVVKDAAEAHGPAAVEALRALPARVILAAYYKAARPEFVPPGKVEALARVNQRRGREGKPIIPSPFWFWPPPKRT